MAKGQKTCPKCQTATGPRAYTCPNEKCGHVYDIKHKTPQAAVKAKISKSNARKSRRVDWTTLEKGDIIKVIAGSGPYYTKMNGETECTGYSGRFRVAGLHKDGIHAYSAKRSEARKGGHCFIYMGQPRATDYGVLVTHRIRLYSKVKKAEADEVATV